MRIALRARGDVVGRVANPDRRAGKRSPPFAVAPPPAALASRRTAHCRVPLFIPLLCARSCSPAIPPTTQLDPERDPVLLPLGERGPEWAEGHGLLPPAVLQYLRKHGPTPLPDTNARATSLDEAPEVVSSLEAFLFRGAEPEEVWADAEEELNTLGLPAPARTMSGWFAARLAAESTSASAPSGAAMGPVRVDATLLERWLAILPTRRAETEARYLTLRRQYVAALKGYFMDAAEQGISLNALHAAAGAARAQVRPGSRPAAFATDEEEWAAVDKMSASSLAVARQNAQLRARLASATSRVSGNLPGEAEARGAGPSASAGDAMQGIEQIDAPVKVAGYGVRQRGAPRTGGPSAGAPVSSLGKGDGAEAVLACGDLVLSPYGRGIVVMQRDGARPSTALPSTTVVTLPYGTAYLSTPTLVLLAVAGEVYTAPASGDKIVLAAAAELRTRGLGTPFEGQAASTAPIASADSLLFGVGRPAAAASPKGGKAMRGKGKAAPPAVHTPPLYGAGSSPATEGGDRVWERGAASRVASSLAEDGVVIDGRVPVFTTSWARNRVPRGVRLALDPLGGSNTLGYVVGEGATGGTGAAAGQAGPDAVAVGGAAATHIVVAAASAAAAAQVRDLYAETQRLRGQNRQAEESRLEQRKRLTDARLTIARLLEQLNSSRAREAELGAELNRREKEVGDCEERIRELRSKYEPQALAADEAVAARAEGGVAASSAAKAMEALVASMSAEQGGEVDLAGLAGLTAAGASLPALKTSAAGGPASSPRAVPGVGTTNSGRKVAPASAGGYRSSIMGQQLAPEEEEDSEKEEDKEGGEEEDEEEDDVATVQEPYDEEDEDGAAVAAALRGAGDDGDSMEDQPVDAASGLMAALQADGGLEEVSGGAAEGAGLAFLEAGLASGLEAGGGAPPAAPAPAGRGGKGKAAAGVKRASTSSARGGARGGKRPRKAMEEDGGGEGGAAAAEVVPPSQSDADTTMSLSQAESEAGPPAAAAEASVADKGAAGAARRGRSSVGRGRR